MQASLIILKAGQAPTLVKRARLCLLAPVVLILGFAYRHRVHARQAEEMRLV